MSVVSGGFGYEGSGGVGGDLGPLDILTGRAQVEGLLDDGDDVGGDLSGRGCGIGAGCPLQKIRNAIELGFRGVDFDVHSDLHGVPKCWRASCASVTHMDQQVRNASEFRATALLFSAAFDRSMITATDKKTAGLSVGGFDGRSPLTAPHEVDNAGPSFFRPTAARK